MIKKINSIRKTMIAAGILCALTVSGSHIAFAAQTGAAVDEKGAEEIAFADSGITEDKAERLRTKAERENGEDVYEVSFTADGVEYEYLIREEDGKILEWEIDGRDVKDAVAEESLQKDSGEDKTSGSSGSTDTLIGLERAKEIALSDAGMDAGDVGFSTIKFEEDHRVMVYKIEFYQDRNEYEYTIDAYSGEVLEIERD